MSTQTKQPAAAAPATEPPKPKPKLTGFDYYLMALEAEGVPFSQVAGEVDVMIRRNR